MSYFHSVTLDTDKCKGCTNCIKRCPTEAIRVRGGKAKIIKERCIDCGECIRVCPYHAKRAVTDTFDLLRQYRYNIALPAPSLYGQFKNTLDANIILTGLLQIGFDDVFEVARGAEVVSDITRRLMREGALPSPVISSACPAVVRLIKVRFPNLIGNILNVLSPMEVSAMLARREAKEKTGLRDEDIGVFFITPCPAKVTSIKAPLALEQSYVSGAVSAKDVCAKLLPLLKNITQPLPLSHAGTEGVSWARSGGESEGTQTVQYIAVDGIDNVMNILEQIEDEKLDDADFIELSACLGGCVGGVLNITNSFVTATRLKHMTEELPARKPVFSLAPNDILFRKQIEYESVMKLDEDFSEAMRKMEEMDALYETMPKLDCGSCGAPSCKALAEDIVRGFGNENACVFKMRERVRELAKELFDLEAKPYGHDTTKEDEP